MQKGRTILLIVVLTIVTTFNFTGKSENSPIQPFNQAKLLVAMDTNHYNYFIRKGTPTGYQFEMLEQYAKHSGRSYEVCLVSNESRFELLRDGYIDILVFSEGSDSLHRALSANKGICSSVPMDEQVKSVWLARNEHSDLIRSINLWANGFKQSKLYGFYQTKYFKRKYDKYPSSLSPYDELFKKYSKEIGWDWRLLASLVYQESMFRPEVRSKHGAAGLMQIMPETAASLGVVNIDNPEENISAGIRLIARLYKLVEKTGIPEEERINFVLASYNAGYGRIEDCRAVAGSLGLNPDSWEDVNTAIPTMRHPSPEQLKLMPRGRFNGKETMNFVEEIQTRYKQYTHFFDSTEEQLALAK
ncbi:MAG: transglycosylase SLT domain-containing protein [Prevotellaceae bacterium]|jgi:membrane-bound lytic murein transglycosylase F|nr:transglycosylase SLT domain-containing protein [Prevotellaceae bacterium]